ncbi:O-antigen ligase family protein [Priestia sp. TGN 0903]|uniref:O-antigen ligase family protein n=1 Tax=Priestia sp. TGN 0903 TaxID=3420730 RepID=UPI003D7814AD
MKTGQISKNIIISIYLYLLAFLIIFSSGAILDQKYPNVAQALLLGLSIPAILTVLVYKRYLTYLSLIPILFIGFNFITVPVGILQYVTFIVKFVVVLLIIKYCMIGEKNLFKIFHNLIVGIAVYTLFTYLFFDILSILPPSTEVINDKPYRVWLGLHFHGQITSWYGVNVFRNNSIFWEPGVWQIYLNYALIYQLFFSKKVNKKILTVLLINLITTFSTTGNIICLMILLVAFLKFKPKTQATLFLKYYLLIPLVAVGFFVAIYLFNQKVSGGGQRSYSLRQDDLLVGWELFLQKPFTGWGFLNNEGYQNMVGVPNNSNGFISMLFQQGIAGAIFYLVPLITLFKKIASTHRVFTAFIFTIFIVISSASEPIMYTNFISFLFCLGVISIIDNEHFIQWFNRCASKEIIVPPEKRKRILGTTVLKEKTI